MVQDVYVLNVGAVREKCSITLSILLKKRQKEHVKELNL